MRKMKIRFLLKDQGFITAMVKGTSSESPLQYMLYTKMMKMKAQTQINQELIFDFVILTQI